MRTQVSQIHMSDKSVKALRLSRQVARSESHRPSLSGIDLPLFLQSKLAVSRPGDPSEIEADRVADQVMRMSVPTVQRQCAACASGGPPCPACEQEESVTVSRKAQGAIGSDASASVGSVIRSPGQPLAASARAFFEPRFGQDLSQVRVHTDPEAQHSARDVNALAYTVGSHMVFDAGRYAPGTTDGQRLLAHELTHVVQQSNGESRVQRQAQEPGVCDPANLGTLGPAFRKSEVDVQRMGLVEKHVIQRPTPNDDFVLYCPPLLSG